MKITHIVEGNRPQKPKPYNSNPVAKNIDKFNKPATHRDRKNDYKRKPKFGNKDFDLGEEQTALQEGPLVVRGESDLLRLLDTLLSSWQSQQHNKKEYAELLRALGYSIEFDGNRATLIKEGSGAIRGVLGAAALITALGMAMPDGSDTPLGKELAAAAQAGDEVAAYHLKNLDIYIDNDAGRILTNLKIAYLDDSPREDVKAYLAKQAGK